MTDFNLPDLPSDEELGIADMEEQSGADEGAAASSSTAPDTPSGDTPAKPPASPGGLPGWTGWVTLVVLLVAGWFSSSYRALPSPAAATAPETEYASGRALPELVELARAPRPPGSPEHARVREWIVDRLERLGLEPRIQVGTHTLTTRNRIRAATVRNVVARVEGSDPTGAVLVMAHYDGVPGSPAAADDGSGVVSILEALRALQAGEQPRNDIIVLFTDAEELGLLGARAFVDEDPWMADVRVVVNVEMRGSGGPTIMFETGDQNGWIAQRFAGSDPSAVAMSVSMAAYERLPNDTDFTAFRDVGVQGLNFAAVGRVRNYHEATDRPEALDESTLQHQGQLLLANLRILGAEDLSEVNGPDRTWFTLPFLGVVTLPALLTLPVTLGILAALLLVTFLASVRGARSRGFLSAAILSTVVVGLSAGAGWVLVNVFLPMSEIFTVRGIVYDEWPWRLALVAGVVALVTGVFSLAHRWMSPLEATLGALFVPVLALLAVTLLAPLGAISLQGPLLATTLLLLLLAGVGLHRARGMTAWIASLVLALPVLAFLVPVVEQIFIAFTMRSAPVLGALTATCLLMILPALSALERPNRWWAPVLAFVIGWVGVGVGWMQRAPSPERPVPSVLRYVLERDDRGLPSQAVWATRTDVGLEWARSAVDGAFNADPTEGELTLATLGLAPLAAEALTASEAPMAALPAPEVTILSERVEAGDRRIRLGVRSRIGAEVLRLELGEGVELLAVSGSASEALLPGAIPPSVRTLEHWGEPDPALVVEISARERASWTVDVVEEHLRPEEIFGPERFRRPPGLMEQAGPWSDRAVIRTPWSPSAVMAPEAATGADTLPAAAMAPDSIPADTIFPDTIPVDSMAGDSIPPDSTSPDTLPPDTVAVDTVPGPPTGGSGA